MMESLGKFLKKERETRNISLEEVSKFTKIKQHHLRAIEEGRCELLPPTPYVKGYLNVYAKYLTIDPKKIVLQYEEYLKSLIPPESVELQHHALSKKKNARPWYSLSFIFS
jgi:cytoskeletal protein RodZ